MSGSVGLVRFCRELCGVELYPRQAELLGAVDEGPRVHVFALGRRSGKTLMMALAALHNLLVRPDLDGMVRPGERRFALVVATNRAQARLLLGAARSIVEQSPALAELLEGSTEDELRFAGGRVLAALPCSSRGVRGWPVSFLALDEFAHFVSDSEGPAAAERVWDALVPATAQFGDAARIVVSSTPSGDSNAFARLYHLAEDGEMPGAVAHRASTQEMNPTITPEFLASEGARDPIAFSSEYEARFVGGSGAFFEEELLEACVVGDDELDPSDAIDWTAGLDPGIWRDPCALAIVGRDPNDPSRLRLGCVRSWTPPKKKPALPFERRKVEAGVLREAAQVVGRYGCRRAVWDGFMAAQVEEALHEVNVWPEKVTLSGPMRLEIFASLRQAMQSGRFSMYRHDGLLAELARIRTSYRGGQLAVETPRSASGHFDMAISTALAVWALTREAAPGTAQPFLVDVSDGDRTPSFVFGSQRGRLPQNANDLKKYVF